MVRRDLLVMAALCSSILRMVAKLRISSSNGRVLLLPARKADFWVEAHRYVKSRKEKMS